MEINGNRATSRSNNLSRERSPHRIPRRSKEQRDKGVLCTIDRKDVSDSSATFPQAWKIETDSDRYRKREGEPSDRANLISFVSPRL